MGAGRGGSESPAPAWLSGRCCARIVVVVAIHLHMEEARTESSQGGWDGGRGGPRSPASAWLSGRCRAGIVVGVAIHLHMKEARTENTQKMADSVA